MSRDRLGATGQGPASTPQLATDTQFEPVTQVRAHEYVAEQIRRHIKLRLTGPGEALPPERELVRQFAVGRPTIQMALKLLEAERLVEARRGRRGGTFILGPIEDEGTRYELVASILRRGDEIDELLRFREAVEPEIARAAAEARRQPDLDQLQAALLALDEATHEAEYMRHDTELHLALGAATQNRFLKAAEEDIRHGLNDVISLLPESDIWHRRVSEEHHRLFEVISQCDADAAAEAMRAHIAHTRQGAQAVLAALRRRDDRWRGR